MKRFFRFTLRDWIWFCVVLAFFLSWMLDKFLDRFQGFWYMWQHYFG